MTEVSRKKIVVDLYCGAGGTTTGMIQAADELGIEIECLAVNHNIFAISTHSANHPGVRHRCQSVEDVDPNQEVPGGILDLLWASLECTSHSNARGGKPMSDQSRSSAWDLLRWCKALDVRTVMIENVREWRDWGPLYPEDYHVVKLRNRPIPERKGEFYRDFIKQLGDLGYHIEERLLNAADFGDPTSRKRLFIQAQKYGPCHWPTPTHGKSSGKPYRTAREIIDWSLKGNSIFGRKKPLAPNTMRRILAGLEKFGSPELKPWLVIFRNNMDGRDLDRPLPTVCTSRGHFGLAVPFLVQYFGGKDAVSLDEPLPTVTANYEHYALCEPFVVGVGGPQGAAEPQTVDQPLGTVLGVNHRAVCEPFLFGMEHTSSDHPCRCKSLDEPLQTVTAKGMFGLIEPFLINISHQGKEARDNGHIYPVDAPVPTIITEQEFALCEPFLVPQFGEREGQAPRTHSVDEPLPAVTGHGAGALVQPFLVEYHGGPDSEKRTRSLDGPLPTQDTSNRFGLVEPFLTKYNGTGSARSVEEPLDTITTKDRFGLCQPECVRDKGGVFLDIRFRMLNAKELAAAMSFPANYEFHGGRERAVKQIGNAVPVALATRLCVAVLGAAE